MEYYIPLSDKEFSQKKLEEYSNFAKIINYGRRNPIWFVEYMYGIQLIDYQAYCFSMSWFRPYVLWLCSRRAGKTTTAAVFEQTKMVLIPNYKVYISTNSAKQSMEIFKMIEDIALQRVPSFATCTDIFAQELERNGTSKTGFIHDPAGHNFRLFNNSELMTLSTNINALRGKGGSVFYDETAWQTQEQMAATEHFADTDTSFKTGVTKSFYQYPEQMPLQLFYASSAGDIEYPFYQKYRSFAMKMFEGDDDYFCCDLNVNTILNHSTIRGEKIKPHIDQKAVNKAVEEDPDAADRELFNKFRRGGGKNAVVKMDVLIRNSEVRIPLLYNDTGKKKFIFVYDPARNYDNSVLGIFQLIDDPEIGYYLRVENVISMVDTESKKKTPLYMPAQLEIIKKQMIKYNGEKAADWENIELYIDSGSGGGGTSAVADQLMEDWTDALGKKHKGIIDPVHKQYATARKKFTNAMPIVHLIDPQGYKNIMFDSLQKMTQLDLIKYTDYDNKDYLLLEDAKNNNDFKEYILSNEEKLALANINIMKMQISYMCRYNLPNGGVRYELDPAKKNTMHDDHAYILSMAAYALALKRRTDLVQKSHDDSYELDLNKLYRRPSIAKRR